MDLTFSVHDHDQITVVSVAGEIDLASAGQLRDRLAGLMSTGKYQLIIDLEAVDFLDSTGLGVLVTVRKAALSSGGDLGLVCTQPNIRRLFEITGLEKVFVIHDSLDAALKTS
ncbi:MAG TPA: STAS domain-containing protein [Mycobacteriales bacterium]|nr:STAS domain-containing protein [Mycobacteriales bacterium]